jgi:hypothetical protein
MPDMVKAYVLSGQSGKGDQKGVAISSLKNNEIGYNLVNGHKLFSKKTAVISV